MEFFIDKSCGVRSSALDSFDISDSDELGIEEFCNMSEMA
jgi:hypothetical protein